MLLSNVNLKRILSAFLCAACLMSFSSPARAAVIADSFDDWSTGGTQGENDWTQGYFNYTLDGDPDDWKAGYNPNDMILYLNDGSGAVGPNLLNNWDGNQWVLDRSGGGGPWTRNLQEELHPNGTNSAFGNGGNREEHWNIRRWTADSITEQTPLALTWQTRATNLGGGNGTTGAVFVNGVLLDSKTVGGRDGVGVTRTVYAHINPGDVIDLALTPENTDGSRDDGSDGSANRLTISDEIPANAVNPGGTLANSIVDWSTSGTQGENGWTYGYFNYTLDGDPNDWQADYNADDMVLFLNDGSNSVGPDLLNNWDGNRWVLDRSNGGGPWTTISQETLHPNGTNSAFGNGGNREEHWNIRRWTASGISPDTPVDITWNTRAQNLGGGSGTTGAVFINGELIDSETVGGTDGVGFTRAISTFLNPGDVVDLVLTPENVDGSRGDGADGSANWLNIEGFVFFGDPPPPFQLVGSGSTFFQDFDSMGTGTGRVMPRGWRAETIDGDTNKVATLGLVDGPLEGAIASAAGVANVGGNAERFISDNGGFLATWKDDVDNSGTLDDGDVRADAATDRALGISRVGADEPGSLNFTLPIGETPLRAFTLDWDLEVWGGDPEAGFRGAEGAGFAVEAKVGGTSYYSETVTNIPGDLFDSEFDLAPGVTVSPTLINGNEHAVRGNSSGIIEVDAADGAVGNSVQLSFNANHGGADEGWIAAIDNVRIRALAAGDAQGDGDVDPADLALLLGANKFGKGKAADATWAQGDFDNDGDFDAIDVAAILQVLAGEFPKTFAVEYSSEAGTRGDGIPDLIVNPVTGEISADPDGLVLTSFIFDSEAGIFDGASSPAWSIAGILNADEDIQISMPINFDGSNRLTVANDLGEGIIGASSLGSFSEADYLADLTVTFLAADGTSGAGSVIVVPEPSSMVLATFGVLGMLSYLRRRRRLG